MEDSNLIPLFLFLIFDAGVFTGAIIRMISDMHAKHGTDSVNLDNCGKFTLAEDLSDIEDITSIDLSNMDTLYGSLDPLANCTKLETLILRHCKALTGTLSVVGPENDCSCI